MRARVELQPGGVAEVVFFLGEAATRRGAAPRSWLFALPISTPWRTSRAAGMRLRAIEVKTPDRAMDLMLNGWLLYQTLACRIWARSASIKPAAPMVFVTNCRTAWRSPSRGPI